MGSLALQENIKKNEEYFENLKKCYNPTQAFFRDVPGRSLSSEGFLNSGQRKKEFQGETRKCFKVATLYYVVFLLDSRLIQSSDDLLSYIKPPRTKIQTVKRSQSSFSISSNNQNEKYSYPIIKIVEKNESMDVDFGTILKVKEATHNGPLSERNGDKIGSSEMTGAQTDEKRMKMKSRDESLEEIRGILRDQLPGSCSVRRIHFSLSQSECEEQLNVPGFRRKLRSPPPFIPDLLTPFNEGTSRRIG